MYKVDLHFDNNEVLNYTSIPYEIANIWIKNFILPGTKSPYNFENNISKSETHFSFPLFNTREELIKQLTEGIEVLRSAGYEIPYDLSAQFDRELLNKLHEYFHTHVETKSEEEKNSFIHSEILNLNYNIHKLEPLLNVTNTFNYSIVAMKELDDFKVTLSEGIKRFFSIETHNEGVSLAKTSNLGYISYATVGKNLLNCFCDNDIDIVSKGLIRNKTKGDNMIQFTYGQTKDHRIKNISYLNKENISGWLSSREIINKDKILTQENLNQVYPPILEMTEECENRYSLQDIYGLYKNSNLVKLTVENL